ncbi:hypothetical protein KX928_21205 [Roseobacter sp. YSTF-M11]|uniref:Gamma-glutamyl kinase n=1 Tax=Roseobacter insulae TaxID=2859783 RepID=A0A9X1FY74_9RHOB|nr:hypothetical protein [Roseobacter insulae]MBW4710315.1 hypothetical protein [Roseobacter insulae]
MLIFLDKQLVYLATPKTGTTAVETALRPRAEILFAKGRKHINAQRYRKKIAPFIEDTFNCRPQTVASMREPVEQIRSWYRYRARPQQDGNPKSTKGMSFDDFVMEVASGAPREFARIGSQYAFLSDSNGNLLVDHLFAYERQPRFRNFLSNRLEVPVELPQKNVSPTVDAPLSDEVYRYLRDVRAAEFELYDQLLAADGYLKSDLLG